MPRCVRMVLSISVVYLMTMHTADSVRLHLANSGAKQRIDIGTPLPGIPGAISAKVADLAPPAAILQKGPLDVGACPQPSNEEIWRLLLSIVADKFGQDNDNAYGGDFFTSATKVGVLRCHYIKVLGKAAEYAAEEYSSRFPKMESTLKRLKTIIDKSHLIAAVGNYKERSVLYVSSIWKRIAMLESEEELFFPCGWKMHAVYCEVIREAGNSTNPTYSFAIYNSGDGIDHHFSIKHNGYDMKYSPVLYFHKIPLREMLHPSMLRAILEPSVVYLSTEGDNFKSDPSTMYLNALGRWENYLDWERSSSVMLDGQTGGTCMVHSLRHYLHYKIRYGLSPDDQHEVGQATYHVMQRAALHYFLIDVENKKLQEIMPEPKSLIVQDGRIWLPEISRNHFARSRDLLRLVARQVMMFAPDHDKTQELGQKLLDWCDRQQADRTKNLVDESNAGSSSFKLEDQLPDISRRDPITSGVAPGRRMCNKPDFFKSFGPGGHVPDALRHIEEITEDEIQICFGETYVDWLAARVLALDLTQVDEGKIDLVKNAFDKLEDQVRRFSATQPFKDHVAALKRLLVKFHELAAVLDSKERKGQGLENAPTLKDFSVTHSIDSLPSEEPANQWFMSMVRTPPPSNASDPIANPYQYIEWNEKGVLFVSDEGGSRTFTQPGLCEAKLFMSDSEEQCGLMYERTAESEVCSSLKYSREEMNIQVRTAEQYARDFIRYVRKTKCAMGSGKRINFKDIDSSSFGDGACVSSTQGPVEDGHAAVCMLAGKIVLEVVSDNGETERFTISSHFKELRQMLILFHLVENGRASRRSKLSFFDTTTYIHRFETQNGGREQLVHAIDYKWCYISPEYSDTVENRRTGWREGTRHQARALLHAELSGKDEKAMTQFLFRDPRRDKWEHGRFMLKRDGENAIVLYDLQYIEEDDKKLSIFQRFLFEFGIHSTQTRQHWLGYLQEHPKCFLRTNCRVANDAILFSDRYDPSMCTSRPETPESYYKQVLKVLDQMEAQLKGGEPSYEKGSALGYIQVTRHRVRAHQGMPPAADEVIDRISTTREGFELHKAGEGDLPEHKLVKELRYAYACIEMMVLFDMQSLNKEVYQHQMMKECAALFQYISARHIDTIDPGILHQANRAHNRLVAKSEEHMCEVMGGGFKSAEFPYLICGTTEMNMLSGDKIDAGVDTLELYQLPIVLREQRFAARARSLGSKSFHEVTDNTFKLVTKDDVEYYFSASGSSYYRSAYIHRKDPNFDSGAMYQLVADTECTLNQVIEDHSSWSGGATWKTDIKDMFLGSVGEDAFCWLSRDKTALIVTSVGKTDGKDEVLIDVRLEGSYANKKINVKLHKSSTQIRPEFANGNRYDLRLGAFWQQTVKYEKNGGEIVTPVALAGKNAGVFTHFHEGRGWLELFASNYGVFFHGVRTPLGHALTLRKATRDLPYKMDYDGEEWEVVEPRYYEEDQGYLLEHGVPHMLLKRGTKYAVLLPGLNSTTLPAVNMGTDDKPKMVPFCRYCEDKKSRSERHSECMDHCWWGLPKRQMLLAEMVADGTGMLIPKSREDRLQIVLFMMKAKKFDHAYLYMNDLDHLSSWTEQTIFLLREFATHPMYHRDPETAYLRLLGVKLLRDECMRFAAAGCEHRLQTHTKQFNSIAKDALSLVLQTQHLMPVYKIVDMRTRKLTRFFTAQDLAADPNGLRGWIMGPGSQDLMPSREEGVNASIGSCKGNLFGSQQCAGVGWLKYHESAWWYENGGKWLSVFPSQFFGTYQFDDILKAFRELDPNNDVGNSQAKDVFAHEVGVISGSDVTATEISNLVNLFLWMQPAMPIVSKFGYAENDRLAFLFRIYLSSSTTESQLKLLQPLAEQWLYTEVKQTTLKMHGAMQLLLSLPANKKLNVFDNMFSNMRNWDSYTKGELPRDFNKPKDCCYSEGAWTSVKNNMDSIFGTQKSSTAHENKYDWHEPMPQQYFEDGAALEDDKCNPYDGSKSASALKSAIMTTVKDNKVKSWKVFDSLPRTDEEILKVLVQLFLGGGQFSAAFPTTDAKQLHCNMQHFMEATTKEAREAAGGRKQTVFLDQWPIKIGRSLLVFEYSTGFTVRAEQVTQLKHLLETTEKPKIMQIMMGGGKTAVLSPVLLQHIDHGMFMSPPGVFNQNAKDLSTKSRSVYGQYGYALACYRTERQQDVETLKWTLRELVRAREKHDYVLMLPKTFQCFQNLLSMSMGNRDRYDLIMEILLELRNYFTAVVDEIDTVFDPNLEVNFPLTKADVDQDMPAMHFLTLLFDVKVYPGENTKLTVPEYEVAKKEMAENMVKRVKDYENLPFTLKAIDPVRMQMIAANVGNCSAKFFIEPLELGKFKGADGQDCATTRDMQIIHMFLKDTFFNIVRMRRNVDYGRSHQKLTQTFVIPYSSANKPVEGSKFSNYLLAAGLALQYWFLDGLDDAMFIKLIYQIRKVKAGGATVEELYKITNGHFPDLKDMTTEELTSFGSIPKELLRDTTLIMGAIGYDVLPSITVSGKQVTNYALNIDNHLKQFIGFSGTMSSNDIFPSRSDVKEDSSVETSLRERTVTKELKVRSHMFELDQDKDFVTQMVTGAFSKTNALLDCGAFLRDEKNKDVAEKVLKIRDDIKAVFYYDDIKNEIVTMLKGGNVERISTSQDLNKVHPELAAGNCSGDIQDSACLSHIFLYCDQQHTVGTDLKLDYQAVAALTIASSANLDELMQAIMRMRNYQGLQSKGVTDGASKLQDVMFVFDEKIPDDLGQLWSNIKKVTEKQVKAASKSVQRRNSNLEYRSLYYKKQPDPVKSFKFAKAIFEREQDFLNPDTPESVIARYEGVKSNLPFALTNDEEERVDKIVKASADAIRASSSDLPDVEEEMEMELEDELEMEIQRLRAHDTLGENSFTVNPMQFPPMYAYCDETAAKSAGYEVPMVEPGYTRTSTSVFPCVPISYWMNRSSDRTQPGPDMRSPVAASHAFMILRPQKKGYSSEYNGSGATAPDQMNLFADPWEFHSNDEYQEGKRDAGLIVDDTRKNLHNVLFIASKEDPSAFQFVLITSDEALLLEDFCSSQARRDQEIEVASRANDVQNRLSSELRRMDEITTCEDSGRKIEHSAYYRPEGKYLFLRLDKGQQYELFKKAYRESSKVQKFLKSYWSGKTCSVFDPLALPEDYKAALMPDSSTRQAFDAGGSSLKDRLIKSLVQILAIAGSQHVVLRDDFKDEFQKQMQTQKYSKVYKKILDFIDEPLDPAELGALTAKGRQCKDQCTNEGRNSYKLEPIVVNSRKDFKCVCVDEVEDPYPSRPGKGGSFGGNAAGVVGVLVCILAVICCCGAAFYGVQQYKQNNGSPIGGRVISQDGTDLSEHITFQATPSHQARIVATPLPPSGEWPRGQGHFQSSPMS